MTAPQPVAECVLTVHLPADATVTINGTVTTSTGGSRRFVSKGLQTGKRYAYTIRILTAGDRPSEQVETLTLTAGEQRTFSFDSDKAVAVNTEPSNDSVVLRD